ncbi:DNA-binding transcriptional ArsR family regulator [Hydrogenispora ethanolica]|jgi:ArsR family transcriptional regulator|uniref:DNA-binding transcriptional ArsR family regulator n=1 Tax=Hydrogenispora ethanolica TaxID=1082276 RepID=A0A4R1RYS8_HYDET|nr:metalloregulator ArsR/SmtB family transcription factor [Hydrogenispora ethanolica]TCL71674.1 DNA-binding transcriptional ArsR family regulator [Hydrogenispora ethanolica]
MRNLNDMTEYIEKAELLKTVAHPVRLCIVQGLMEQGECNVNHMQSCLHIPQSTISQHLAKMRSGGVLKCRREGVEVYYQVANEVICQVVRALFSKSGGA